VTMPLESLLPRSFTAVVVPEQKRRRHRSAALPARGRPVRAVWRRRAAEAASASKRARAPEESCDASTAGD
jgi:hypothetical protein